MLEMMPLFWGERRSYFLIGYVRGAHRKECCKFEKKENKDNHPLSHHPKVTLSTCWCSFIYFFQSMILHSWGRTKDTNFYLVFLTEHNIARIFKIISDYLAFINFSSDVSPRSIPPFWPNFYHITTAF